MKTWIGWLVGMSIAATTASQAQQVRPPAGNPLQNLPELAPPKGKPAVTLDIQTRRNPQLDALLTTHLHAARFEIAGVHALQFADVANLFKPLSGMTVSVGQLVAAADRVTALYRARGYALSFAYVPDQDFSRGQIHVTVVEGYVARLQISGDAGNLAPKIRAIAQHILAERPLRTRTFQRYIQILGRLPGVTIHAEVPAPTTTDGATTLQLTVKRQRYNLDSGIDFNHPGVQGLETATLNGMTPLGEQLTIAALYPHGSDDEDFYSAALAVPMGSDGLSTRLAASRYSGQPETDSQLPPYLRYTLTETRIDFGLSYPLQLAPDLSKILGAGIYSSDETDQYLNTISGAQLQLQSHLRVAHIDYDSTTSIGDNCVRSVSLGIAQGLDIWGAATRLDSNVDMPAVLLPGAPDFLRYNASFSQTDQWPLRFGTRFSFAGQYSHNSLPTTEQISFGGPRFGLAYDPGDAVGDSGWGAAAELNRSYPSANSYLKSLVPYVEIQWARVYLNQGTPLVDRLGSAVLGVRLTDNRHYTIDLSLAQPIGDRPPESPHREPRGNLTFSYKLF